MDVSKGRRRSRRSVQLARLVAEYVAVHRPRSEASWRWYASAGSLREAIRRSVIGPREDGLREPNQREVPHPVLVELAGNLSRLLFAPPRDFGELHDLVRRAAHGIDSQTVYDVAWRIGAYLRLRPQHVYLAGQARAGAHSLGIKCAEERVAICVFPAELQVLRSWEIAELLGVCSAQFAPGGQPNAVTS